MNKVFACFILSVIILSLFLISNGLFITLHWNEVTITNKNIPIAMIPNINTVPSDFYGNVTVIITSCSRWDELSLSIESFEKYNTYSYINNKIVMDDCADTVGLDKMHRKYYKKYRYNFYHTTTPLPSSNHSFASHPKYSKTTFRPIASLYEAMTKYTSNGTQWIFQSEDDWLFYRYGFIEYSFLIYNHSKSIYPTIRTNKSSKHYKLKYKQISFASLKNTQSHPPKVDMREFCGGPYIPLSSLGKQQNSLFYAVVNINNTLFDFLSKNRLNETVIKYYIAQTDDCYGHYAMSPGLKHKNRLIDNIEICLDKAKGVGSYERCVGCQFKFQSYATASMRDNGFVGHLGHSGRHISIQDVTGKANTKQTEVNAVDVNQIIPMDNGWFLNQSVCKYFRRKNESVSPISAQINI